MSVRKRKTKNGFSQDYHYQFIVKGKMYCGVCIGCKTKKDAERYEQEQYLPYG